MSFMLFPEAGSVIATDRVIETFRGIGDEWGVIAYCPTGEWVWSPAMTEARCADRRALRKAVEAGTVLMTTGRDEFGVFLLYVKKAKNPPTKLTGKE